MKLVLAFIAAWIAIGGAAANAAPFSHKLHLQLKLECPGCHTAAVASTKPEDNLLPDKRSAWNATRRPTSLVPLPPGWFISATSSTSKWATRRL
jgi:hypothetical protein